MKRLDQFLSQLKYGSRSEVEKMIKQGLVTVNGVIAKSGRHKIDPLVCEVHMNGQKVFYKEPIDIILYKPQGYISSNKDDISPLLLSVVIIGFNHAKPVYCHSITISFPFILPDLSSLTAFSLSLIIFISVILI